jgi:phosphoenolpyruvate-protein kinase (PTS system EI component)
MFLSQNIAQIKGISGQIAAVTNHKSQITITNHKSQITITNHKSQITNHNHKSQSQLTNHKSQITNHKSQITNHNHKSQIISEISVAAGLKGVQNFQTTETDSPVCFQWVVF